jgi:hypothetical protein
MLFISWLFYARLDAVLSQPNITEPTHIAFCSPFNRGRKLPPTCDYQYSVVETGQAQGQARNLATTLTHLHQIYVRCESYAWFNFCIFRINVTLVNNIYQPLLSSFPPSNVEGAVESDCMPLSSHLSRQNVLRPPLFQVLKIWVNIETVLSDSSLFLCSLSSIWPAISFTKLRKTQNFSLHTLTKA